MILPLQRTAGNRAVQRSLVGRPPTTVQRVTPDQRITAALEKPDPVAGVGDFAEAFRILNGLAMYDIVDVLTRLKGRGTFDLLNANLDRAVGVHVPRLRVAFRPEG